MFVILDLERGIPSKRASTTRIDYVPALCTHRPSLLPIECQGEGSGLCAPLGQLGGEAGEVDQILAFRGRRSRNKVSVGEPAEGSLPAI